MRFARGVLIFSYGLFTIVAQTLLFREFVTAFEGNDISVGVFFGSWFLWIGLGAVLVRWWGRLAETLLHHVERAVLIYVPAFAAQLLLVVQVRSLAGVASYDLMSVQTIVCWAIVVNAPVSLVTGALFPVMCRWVERSQSFAVSRVYILEAAGSFAGGLVATGLLACHVPTLRVFHLVAFVLLCSVALVALTDGLTSRDSRTSRSRASCTATVSVSLVLAVLSVVSVRWGFDTALADRVRVLKWSKLFRTEGRLQGTFHTAQAEYLYGEYRGQWVVLRDGGVCEALPNDAAAGHAAAVSLCQVPQARRVLVIGAGLALCSRFLELPQIQEVVWAHPDTEYVNRVPERAPHHVAIDDGRFQIVRHDVRQFLRAAPPRFDVVVVNVGDVANSTLNRYFTLEFYKQVKASLSPDGIVSVSIAGAENVLGAELISLGASVKATLENVFSHLVLVPGDEAWFIVSDSPQLTGDPAALRDRYAGIRRAGEIFPPTGLMSVYLPERAARALERYEQVDLPEDRLVNRDARPLTHLYSLLLAARQSGASATRLVELLAVVGWPMFAVPILVFAALRIWSASREMPGKRRSSFDSSFLVFSGGWVSIGSVIVLMYLYQTHFGSLYLHVGVISSLFMAGLTVGALVIGRAAVGGDRTMWAAEGPLQRPVIVVLLVHALVLAAIGLWLSRASLGAAGPGHAAFAMVFILSGLCCGGYWPIAAAQLARRGFRAAEAGSHLDMADHLGACLGGLVTSLLMVPVLGTWTTLLVLVGLVLANVPAAALAWRQRGAAAVMSAQMPYGRKVGYALFGIAATLVIGSNLLTAAGAKLRPALPDYAVQTLADPRPTQEAVVALVDSRTPARYFTLSETEEDPAAYIFSSADFAPAVRGFGGRVNLAVCINEAGILRDFLIVQSNETPSYLELLRRWQEGLKGRNLFSPVPFEGVHGVTGATVSSKAVLAALEQSAERFAAQVLGRDILMAKEPGTPAGAWTRYVPETSALYLVAVFLVAVLVTVWGGFWSRLTILALSFALGGVLLNTQYSTEQIATLLSLHAPSARLTGAFLLVIGVPLLVVLFGNVYCGYVCPFGAAQELLGYVVPRRFKPTVSGTEMRAGRFVKYVVLFVLMTTFFVSRNRSTLAGDPLVSVFQFQPSIEGVGEAVSSGPYWMLVVVGVAMAGSLFFVRFWCRYLCPAGAFLSLLNRFALLKRWLPAKRFGRCEFGLTVQDRLDCIYCDRCRHPVKGAVLPQRGEGLRSDGTPLWVRPFVVAVLLVGVFVTGVSLHRFRRVLPKLVEEPVAAVGAGGQPRDVDIQRIKMLIEQGRLSDRQAEYYRRVGQEASGEEALNDESSGSAIEQESGQSRG